MPLKVDTILFRGGGIRITYKPASGHTHTHTPTPERKRGEGEVQRVKI